MFTFSSLQGRGKRKPSEGDPSPGFYWDNVTDTEVVFDDLTGESVVDLVAD